MDSDVAIVIPKGACKGQVISEPRAALKLTESPYRHGSVFIT